MLRSVILAASRNRGIERVVSNAPVTRSVVRRYVGGSDTSAAVGAASALVEDGLTVTLDHLGEDTTDAERAADVERAYLRLMEALDRAGLAELTGPLTARSEISVKLSAIGQALPGDGEKLALELARRICSAARAVGAMVTLDMEDHTTVESTLSILAELRTEYPETGAVLQSYLRRTEDDCGALARAGSRVRLCKGAYDAPPSVAYQSTSEIDLSYVRCANILLAGEGYPMFATHDPRLIAIVSERAKFYGKMPDQYEMQMLYGVRPTEQLRLARAGQTVRVYLPYGVDWYGYLVRRLAERPSNLVFFLRSLVSKR